MVEGARLESVYRGNSIVGSNPTLSATLQLTAYRHPSPASGNFVRPAPLALFLAFRMKTRFYFGPVRQSYNLLVFFERDALAFWCSFPGLQIPQSMFQ